MTCNISVIVLNECHKVTRAERGPRPEPTTQAVLDLRDRLYAHQASRQATQVPTRSENTACLRFRYEKKPRYILFDDDPITEGDEDNPAAPPSAPLLTLNHAVIKPDGNQVTNPRMSPSDLLAYLQTLPPKTETWAERLTRLQSQ